MKSLAKIKINTLESKAGVVHEVVVVTAEPSSTYENEQIAETKKIEQFSFWTDNEGLDKVIKHLQEVRDNNESIDKSE